MTTITPDWIARAASAGACTDALAWLRAAPRTVDEMCTEHLDWALWAGGAVDGAVAAITPERLDACAAAAPRTARMGRRRHVREVELGDDAHGLEDLPELLGQALDLVIGEREPREPRDVEHFFS